MTGTPGLKDLVRRGYDAVSYRYRSDADSDAGERRAWIGRLVAQLSPGASVLDLGCGCGIPVSRDLALDKHVGIIVDPDDGTLVGHCYGDASKISSGPAADVKHHLAGLHIQRIKELPLVLNSGRGCGGGGEILNRVGCAVRVGKLNHVGSQPDASGCYTWEVCRFGEERVGRAKI